MMDKLWVALCVTCLFVSISALKDCNGDAVCLPIEKCKLAFENLKVKNIQDILRKTSCGFERDKPHVCCPPIFVTFGRENLLPNISVCGIQTDERIYGGDKTDIDEHPWMALLRYDKPKGSHGFYCGGVLISSRYILTAAHCIKGADIPPSWKLSHVRLGEWNLTSEMDCRSNDCSPPVVDVPVEKLIPHEDYRPRDGNQQNDIALIRLGREVKFNDFVKPICLPTSEELHGNSYEGWDMEVAGWGKTEHGSTSDVKLKVKLPIVSHQNCMEVYALASRLITDKQLCAGGLDGQDSCRGDSGGSLMGQATKKKIWFAFGVVSYGPSPCGTPGWPGVYTRVTAFSDWILSKLEP